MEVTNSIASDWLGKVEQSSRGQDILTRVINSNIEALKLVHQNISRGKLEQAVDMICNAEHIYLLGEGTAGIIATEAYDFMIRSGFRCFHEEDWQRKSLIASQSTEHDLAVLITTTGTNANVISLTKRFQERNCPILGICNYKNTAFTQYVTLLLAPFDDLLTIHDNNFTLRIPIITILEVLYYMIVHRQKEKHEQVLNKNKILTREESIVNVGTDGTPN